MPHSVPLRPSRQMLSIQEALRLPWWRLRLPDGLEALFEAEVAATRGRYLQSWLFVFIVFNLVSTKTDFDMLGPVTFAGPAYLTVLVFVPAAIFGLLLLSGCPSSFRLFVAVALPGLVDLGIVLNSIRLAEGAAAETYMIMAAIVPLAVGLVAPLAFRYTLAYCLLSLALFIGFLVWFGPGPEGRNGVATLVAMLILVPPKLSFLREREAKRSFLLGLQAQLDADALKAANEQLMVLSERDALTGIANRRQFTRTLDRDWREACRTGDWFATLLVDIDHFKRFNDTAGHAAGDRCLAQVAMLLDEAVSQAGGLLARYGGEEFVALLPGVDARGAAAVAERLRLSVSAFDMPHPGLDEAGCVTISVGVAAVRGRAGLETLDLLKAPDEALYEAKRRGRNRVVMAPEAAPQRRYVESRAAA
jgi:diguanylate cyclase (GGDEF)-like protein